MFRLQMISRTDRFLSLKHAFPLRPATRRIDEAKGKTLHISFFKGSVQNEKAGDASSKPVLHKNPVKISFVQPDREGTVIESPTNPDMPVCSASESNMISSRSQAIRALFTKWLNLLHTEALGQAGDDVLQGSHQMNHLQEQKAANTKERGEILKVVLCYFLGLDATVTIPLLIFIPLYLGINVVYGAEVVRELTPLWIIGPLVVALYVKLFRWLVGLYVFSFKKTINVIKNLPSYYLVASTYIAQGKLKEDIWARFWQPVVDIKNLDYKELLRRKLKDFGEWLVEKYLDFVESIWPYYCRTIRFLKRANLI